MVMPMWFSIVKALVPIIRLLIEMFFPKVKDELEAIWEFVENFVPTSVPDMPMAAITSEKQSLWNEKAAALLDERGIKYSASGLNLLREITHARMTSPNRK